jgi:hypothetical protein
MREYFFIYNSSTAGSAIAEPMTARRFAVATTYCERSMGKIWIEQCGVLS